VENRAADGSPGWRSQRAELRRQVALRASPTSSRKVMPLGPDDNHPR
jgi:hypothetical protein